MDDLHPIVTDNSIIDFLVRSPTREEEEKFLTFKISPTEIDLLEDEWKINPNATVIDLPAIKTRNCLQNVLMKYEDEDQYWLVFSHLVNMEWDQVQNSKEKILFNEINIKWEKVNDITWIAHIKNSKEKRIKELNVSQKVELISDEVKCNQIGKIIKIDHSDSNEFIDIEFNKMLIPPISSNSKYSIKKFFNYSFYERQIIALNKFADSKNDLISPLIKDIILGHLQTKKIKNENISDFGSFNIPGLNTFNLDQKEIIKKSLESPFSLIQGPPGTGKTEIIAALVYKFIELKKGPVLVCAPTKNSVEHVTSQILKTGVNVVHFSHHKYENETSDISNITTSKMIFNLNTSESKELLKLKEKRNLNSIELNRFENLIESIENSIISKADCICCTCESAGNKKFNNSSFPIVIIDQSTQIVEPTTLIPILHRCQQVILIGDSFQTTPPAICSKAEKAGYYSSLFDRLIQIGLKPFQLTIQYRMHPSLVEFPSKFFYDGIIQNGFQTKNISFPKNLLFFPNQNFHMLFHNSTDEEKFDDKEAFITSLYISKLCKSNIQPKNIGVITPYSSQADYIKAFLSESSDLPIQFYKEIEIGTSLNEKDYVIVSLVRSNKTGDIGCLNDARMLNVFMTRARIGLIIIGSAQTLCTNKIYYDLICFFGEKELIVECRFKSQFDVETSK